MTLLYSNPCYLDHKTSGHPESPERLSAVVERLRETELDQQCGRPACPPVSPERLTEVHHPAYVEVIQEYAAMGGGRIDADTILSRRSYDTAVRAAGAVCDAVENVLAGEDKNALCLVRPPGHHARPQQAMGFCLFNNVAIGAAMATAEKGLDRVLVVDFDVHHGNGTQEAFYESDRVGFLSNHRYPFYPGTGAEDETGTGAGLGYTVNLPTRVGDTRKEQITAFRDEMTRFADRLKPQMVLISAGFDGHYQDPVGGLGQDTETITEFAKICLDIADSHCDGKVVSVLEGGYNPTVLAECVEMHLRELLVRSGQ
jgi:acetoin utilization deacetylase AcuC-like enzyme